MNIADLRQAHALGATHLYMGLVLVKNYDGHCFFDSYNGSEWVRMAWTTNKVAFKSGLDPIDFSPLNGD